MWRKDDFEMPSCGAKILSSLRKSMITTMRITPVPKICPEREKPFPWTVESLDALRDLVELDDDLDTADAVIC